MAYIGEMARLALSRYYQAFVAFAGCNVVLAICAAIFCAYVALAAAGSGIPEVKAYLNGVDAHSILAPTTLIVKVMKDAAVFHDKKWLFFSTLMNDNLLECIASRVNILERTAGIDAHVGSVNDLAFSYPNKQLCIVTCGEDRLIKVWDAVTGTKQYTFEGHEAPVYYVCPHFKENIQVALNLEHRDGKGCSYGPTHEWQVYTPPRRYYILIAGHRDLPEGDQYLKQRLRLHDAYITTLNVCQAYTLKWIHDPYLKQSHVVHVANL